MNSSFQQIAEEEDYYEYISTKITGKSHNIAIIYLNRPDALNALSNGLIRDLNAALDCYENNKKINVIIITGCDKAFSIGADVNELKTMNPNNNTLNRFLNDCEKVTKCQKPIIAVVNGYALGGGCELAMMCDIIYAGDKSRFGQPEIKLGTIPGLGGSQRLTRLIGKSNAMELCLSGEMIDAYEAKRIGLISKIYPVNQVIDKAIELAEKISKNSPLIIQMCKSAINSAYETTLYQGLRYERSTFYSTFSTKDCAEGMTAYLEKRTPNFKSE